MTEPARPLSVRKQDTLYRLEHDVDLWVATASADGAPYLMPLSFLWDGKTLLLSTARNNPTARNLRANPTAHLTLGHTRDVVHIAGTSQTVQSQDLLPSEAEAFATKAGFDPRKSAYPYFRITPTTIQSWREVDELSNRVLMQDGAWVV